MSEKPDWIPENLIGALMAAEKMTPEQVRQHCESLPEPTEDETVVATIPFEMLRLLAYAKILETFADASSDEDQSRRYDHLVKLIENVVFGELEIMYGLWGSDDQELSTGARRGGVLVWYAWEEDTTSDEDDTDSEPGEVPDKPPARTYH